MNTKFKYKNNSKKVMKAREAKINMYNIYVTEMVEQDRDSSITLLEIIITFAAIDAIINMQSTVELGDVIATGTALPVMNGLICGSLFKGCYDLLCFENSTGECVPTQIKGVVCLSIALALISAKIYIDVTRAIKQK
jgi:hypothetical protein